MPGINDDPRQVEAILEAAADAGATGIGGIALHLRGEVRGVFMDWLRSYRPDLVEHYEQLYRRGAYAPPEERRRLSRLLQASERTRPMPFSRDPAWRSPSPGGCRPDGAGGGPPRRGSPGSTGPRDRGRPGAPPPGARPREVAQTSLF